MSARPLAPHIRAALYDTIYGSCISFPSFSIYYFQFSSKGGGNGTLSIEKGKCFSLWEK
jgi:hypothetical protein